MRNRTFARLRDYSLSHVSDAVLLSELAALVARDRVTTATILAHLAEVDTRRLYAPAGYPSMFAYCLEELRLSEDAAYKRIRAARAARQFPALFVALAEGRLHLAAVSLLAPHLTSENAEELIEAATHRKKCEVEELLAQRFPASRLPEPPTRVRPVPAMRLHTVLQLAPGRVGTSGPGDGQLVLGTETDPESASGCAGPADAGRSEDRLSRGNGSLARGGLPQRPGSNELHALGQVGHVSDGEQLALGRVGNDPNDCRPTPEEAGRADAAPPAQRYLVQLTIARSTHDKLRYAQALLSHAVPVGDVAQVVDRALDALIAQLEKKKVGASSSLPRHKRIRAPETPRNDRPRRHIPAHVRRAVWERDQGQCTFVSASGHRCTARRFLEFDHVEPVARGGRATVEGLRLRCRAHNQYEAERAFGAEFMSRKRLEARLGRLGEPGRLQDPGSNSPPSSNSPPGGNSPPRSNSPP